MSVGVVFTDLVDRYARELLGYLWRMLGDHQEAEDCLQEVFLRAFRAFDRLEEDSNHRAWLYAIATNTARNQRRDRARRQTRERSSEAEGRDDGPTPEGQLVHKELLAAVKAEVDRLSTRQRAALMMRKYHELEYEEIGAALGCSADTARAHVYQALRKLRRRLSPGEKAKDRA
jgi:RNA polymerase sigma-70 factor (ECF subfamily)